MGFDSKRQLIKFILACFLAALLVLFGIFILSLANNDVSPGQFFLFGSILILAGIFVTSTPNMQDDTKWILGFLLIGTGFYQFGRASGLIKVAWLAYLAGIACFIAAGLILYITRPKITD